MVPNLWYCIFLYFHGSIFDNWNIVKVDIIQGNIADLIWGRTLKYTAYDMQPNQCSITVIKILRCYKNFTVNGHFWPRWVFQDIGVGFISRFLSMDRVSKHVISACFPFGWLSRGLWRFKFYNSNHDYGLSGINFLRCMKST